MSQSKKKRFSFGDIFSLSPYPSLARPITVVINLILLAVWLAVYFAQDTDGAVIATAVIYGIHSFGILGVFVWSLIYPRAVVDRSVLIELMFALLVTVSVFTVAYATLLFADPTSFEGGTSGDDRLVILGISLFMSVSTIASHASGSGFIIPTNGWALLLLGLNAVISLTIIVFGASIVISLLSDIRHKTGLKQVSTTTTNELSLRPSNVKFKRKSKHAT